MATTENVTVLFTDLVGSTELASSLTPEAGDEVRRGHFSVLRQAIAETGGTEVKNLGDGLMVVFPSTSAALSCAVGMQQGVDRDNRDLDRPLGLRVGVSIGEATTEADDYFGDPVIEAARLCAKADGGQILAADAVRVMAGRRALQEFRSLGELTLKVDSDLRSRHGVLDWQAEIPHSFGITPVDRNVVIWASRLALPRPKPWGSAP